MSLYARLLGDSQHIGIPAFVGACVEVIEDRYDFTEFRTAFGLDETEGAEAIHLMDVFGGETPLATADEVQHVLEMGYAGILYTTEALVRARLGVEVY